MERSEINRKTLVPPSSSSSFRLRSPSLNSLRLHRVFDLFDSDGDGCITAEELSQALHRLGLDTDFADLKSTVTSFIKKGKDGLEFDDFEALHRTLDEALFGGSNGHEYSPEEAKAQEESDLNEAFKVFDEDGDGYISATELQVVLNKLGLPEGNEIHIVEQMIVSVDSNLDGRVDFFEFKNMMSSIIVPSS